MVIRPLLDALWHYQVGVRAYGEIPVYDCLLAADLHVVDSRQWEKQGNQLTVAGLELESCLSWAALYLHACLLS